eukprot:COSAG03_NODE_19351_length_338_cov_1.075314_1_plen_50_part_10
MGIPTTTGETHTQIQTPFHVLHPPRSPLSLGTGAVPAPDPPAVDAASVCT